jgi:hypothetical protein
MFQTKNEQLKMELRYRIAQYRNYINGLSEPVSYKQLPEWKRLSRNARPQLERVAKIHVEETVKYINRPLFDNNQDCRDFEYGLYDAVIRSYLTNKPVETGILTVLPQNYGNQK